jgi:hypothetical protein
MIIPFFEIKCDLLFYDLLMFDDVFFNDFFKMDAASGCQARVLGTLG